jgi:hypothetical protein
LFLETGCIFVTASMSAHDGHFKFMSCTKLKRQNVTGDTTWSPTADRLRRLTAPKWLCVCMLWHVKWWHMHITIFIAVTKSHYSEIIKWDRVQWGIPVISSAPWPSIQIIWFVIIRTTINQMLHIM